MKNQLSFMFAIGLLVAVATSSSAMGASALLVPMESQQVIMPSAATAATGTMTLEQLLLWIQQYNLAHPDNPIVLDMNTILSAPPQQIKTVIETHVNTHSNDGGGNNDHHDHHKFNWNDLFHGGGVHHGPHDHPINVGSGVVRSPHDSLDDFIVGSGGSDSGVPDGSHGGVNTVTPIPTSHDGGSDDDSSSDSSSDSKSEGSSDSGSSSSSSSSDSSSGSSSSSDSSDGGDSGSSDGGGGDSGGSSDGGDSGGSDGGGDSGDSGGSDGGSGSD